ncbi:hypothetical protein ACFWER_11360, partial [Streptomyces sp. NPDC060188]
MSPRPPTRRAERAIGLDVYDPGAQAVESVRAMMRQSVGAVPDGLAAARPALTAGAPQPRPRAVSGSGPRRAARAPP